MHRRGSSVHGSSSSSGRFVSAQVQCIDFHECSCSLFRLAQVVNVVKRADSGRGSRYLLELAVKDRRGHTLRLSRYIYKRVKPTPTDQINSGVNQTANQPALCNPVGLEWNPAAAVNIIVAGNPQNECSCPPLWSSVHNMSPSRFAMV